MKTKSVLALATLALTATLSIAQTQGVSKTEILVGTIQDFSGPLAGYGKQVRNGMLLRIEEVNEQGGVHGRRLKLAAEDDGYDPKKAVLAAQKLVNKTKSLPWWLTSALRRTWPPCRCSFKRTWSTFSL